MAMDDHLQRSFAKQISLQLDYAPLKETQQQKKIYELD